MAREAKGPNFILGPVLYFRGEQADRWRLSALFVLEGDAEPEDLTVDGVTLPVPPRHLAAWRGRHVWRFDFAVPRGRDDTEVGYGFGDGGRRWRINVPGRGRWPHIAYTSCNGTEDERPNKKPPGSRNALWRELLERHAETPFHILVQGGDQLYADRVWRDCPSLADWAKRPSAVRYAKPFTSAMAEEVMAFYFNLYVTLWSQPEVADAIARIPSVMMWDDHDIFDGWGSLREAAHHAKVNRGVYMVARRHFSLFQVGAAPESPPESVWGAEIGTHTLGFRIGDLGIFAPDLRSERTPTRILSAKTWEALPGWLDRFRGCRHLLFLSSVPLLFPNVAWLERFLNSLPGRTHAEDDLRDQWRSYAHAAEWQRLVEALASFSLRSGCRVTALSGEIHAGARAVLRGGGVEMWQLIASGIVHPPPSRFRMRVMERLGTRAEAPFDGYAMEMPPFMESGRRFIRSRNWLAVTFDSKGQLHAQWHAEGRSDRYLQVI